MPHSGLKCLSGLAAMCAVVACSPVPYTARPLDPDATAAAFQQRSTDADGLRQFAAANDVDVAAWPPAQWGLRELTLVALYFNPDIRTARARAEVARAELSTAAHSQAWAAKIGPEYHSRELPEDKGPWTLGLQLEIPLVAQDKKSARTERGAFLADAADLDIADAAWTVRARVRDRYLDLLASRDMLASLDAQVEARKEMLALVERRVEAGMLSSHELGVERIALSQQELLRAQESAKRQRAMGELATAMGLPLEVAQRMVIRFDARESAGADMDAGELRRAALRNRLDVHRRLLEFGAADAEVKAAVAAQNPDITFGPGYAWDQGDNVWSLAVGMTLPSGQARAGVREAVARRELAAENFSATQAGAISSAERTAAQYRLAFERVVGAERQLQLQRAQEGRTLRQFEKGTSDRMQRVAARLDTLASESGAQAALADLRQSIAHLEDSIQRPLLGDFSDLPDVRITRSAGVASDAGKP
ncbi:MAG TPA: TolC family protein [Burkholderiales bacterium]|nr:TolC family protein [Burkholderiales bacterium]